MKMPFLPPGREVLRVSPNDKFMLEARRTAELFSMDGNFPTGAVVVFGGEILGRGSNGSDFHKKNGCERRRLRVATGEKYELCEGCHPRNHAERRALADVKKNGASARGADIFLWGHWWCCQSCWSAMIDAGIERVFLCENAFEMFVGKK